MIFRLNTLYKRDSNGKIREYTIEWTGKPINILGIDYVYRRVNPKLLNILKQYEVLNFFCRIFI